MSTDESFEEAWPDTIDDERFVLDLDGYGGPIDVLLTLARDQKVDLAKISILDLADQYLSFIARARRLRLELAADYLVMAAWLAYLKSRMLLPEPEDEDEPSGEEMAARLQFQLERLQAMRDAIEKLTDRHRLGVDVFPRGMPEGVRVIRRSVYDCSLHELLAAYTGQLSRGKVTSLRLAPPPTYSVDEAIQRLGAMLGTLPDWASLETFLPASARTGFQRRSAVASTLAASLELVRQGKLTIRQGQMFGPIFLKGANPE